MTAQDQRTVLPYSAVVGQEAVKRALEVAFVVRGAAGVLLTGQRGTAKSTVVRGFAQMAYGELPVTLPINATDDRVVGGWSMTDLMQGKAIFSRGLVEEAAEKGMLYVDEVNLLDDHIVNLLLDVSSTGVLSVQRDMLDHHASVAFNLVGTMNPEEGGLRPQLLDRFSLMVDVQSINDARRRRQILDAVLAFDLARAADRPTRWLRSRLSEDARRCEVLLAARERFETVDVPAPVRQLCARLGEGLELAGHRGEYVTVIAARALAAIDGVPEASRDHVLAAAPMALAHRTQQALDGGNVRWTEDQQARLEDIVGRA
jgi:magnesium chelatase subunit I